MSKSKYDCPIHQTNYDRERFGNSCPICANADAPDPAVIAKVLIEAIDSYFEGNGLPHRNWHWFNAARKVVAEEFVEEMET